MDSAAAPPPRFESHTDTARSELTLFGDWCAQQALPEAQALIASADGVRCWTWRAGDDFRWDSHFMARLLRCARHCEAEGIELDIDALPEGVRRLFSVATAVRPQSAGGGGKRHHWLNLSRHLANITRGTGELLGFIGGAAIAFTRLLRGRANTRGRDIWYFIEQCGPQAAPIVALIAVLVGMILAYLGSVQLRQFGAEVYVADLVALGMVREMGVLMTAVIMAGRTGAAYAAQLGAMQSNEEIDAVTTLGISPMEYLVLPRLLALTLVMPLLVMFANAIGLAGGALVAAGMDVSFTQFIQQARGAVDVSDIFTGLLKSVVFGALIAIAGCQAGMASGRSSAAVGQATTRAVVNAIVYLVVADAALNILYDKLDI